MHAPMRLPNDIVAFPNKDLLNSFLHAGVPTLNGVVADETPGRGTERPPQPGRACDFDGVNDEVIFPTFPVSGAISFSVWFKSGRTTNQILFGDSHLSSYYCNISGLNFTFWIQGTPRVTTFAGNVSDGAWHHAVITLSESELKVYFDGVLVNTAADTPYSGNLDLVLGNSTSADAFYDGLLFDFRCYQESLTPTEGRELFELGADALPNKATLVHFKGDDQHPTIAFDSSGNGRHGTKTGINAAVGAFHWEGPDVPFSWQNEVGYSTGLIPRDESNKSQDVTGAALSYTGQCPYPAQLTKSHCGAFDGVSDYLSIPSLVGSETVISSDGTAVPTISAGRIDFTAGTCWDLRLSNGSLYAFSEGGGAKIHDVSGNNRHGDAVGIDWTQTQHDYHRNMLVGFTLYEHATLESIKVPYVAGAPLAGYTPEAGYSKTFDCPAGAWHNGSESHIDFTGGVAFPGSSALDDDWFFNDSQTNPHFHRTLTRNGRVFRADRFLNYKKSVSGERLAVVQSYTATAEV